MLGLSRSVIKTVLALSGVAACAFGQLTVSARPGLLNYFEGEGFVNAIPLRPGQNTPLFLNANDSITMGNGKAEILLMPGVFLRIGDHSEMVMAYPSLVDTRVEMRQGEAILEAVGLVRGTEVQVIDGNAVISITANGLYRIRAGATPSAAVYQGSAEVSLGADRGKLHRGHQTALAGPLRIEKMDLDEEDDLYAWSSVRSQYEAAASYESARTLAASNQAVSSGWYFNDMLNCWAWLSNGAFFSPFGWGFYSPTRVGGAIVVKCPVLSGGHWHRHPHPGDGTEHPGGHHPGEHEWVGIGSTRVVPINPRHPPALGGIAASPHQERMARSSPENRSRFDWFRGNQLNGAHESRSDQKSTFHGTRESASGDQSPSARPSASAQGSSHGGHSANAAGGHAGFSGGHSGASGNTHASSGFNGGGGSHGSGGGGGSHGGGFSGGGGGGGSHGGGGFSGGGGGGSHGGGGGGGGSSSSSGGGGHK